MSTSRAIICSDLLGAILRQGATVARGVPGDSLSPGPEGPFLARRAAALLLALVTTGFLFSVEVVPAQSGGIAAAARDRAVWVERETYLMGTVLRAVVQAADKDGGVEVLESSFEEVRRMDHLLSTWRHDSELARLNRSEPGVPVPASPELLSLLAEVAAWRAATQGAFEPGIGSLIDAWDLRGRGRRPSPAELREALALSGPAVFRVDPAARTVTRLRAGSWLDSGGFGKGAALREVRRVLEARGIDRALFDFGGQLLAVGAPEGEAGWRIGVAHPERRDEPVAELRVADRSVATTSASERFVEVGGERLGHVLDPRTGRPVPAWGSVTVVADDPLVADILSTALFVLGRREGWSWARAREDVGVLFLEPSEMGVEARWNRAMERWLVRAPGGAGRPGAPGAAP